jgi:hypothetical protein
MYTHFYTLASVQPCSQGVTNFDVKRIADIVETGGVKVEANQVSLTGSAIVKK